MTVKQQTLEVLENNRGKFISGAELAEKLCVSRNAVWKAIKALQEEGYEISAISNKGYSLSDSSDILSEQGIKKHLKNCKDCFDISVYKTISSTNIIAKELASKGAKEGRVIVSEEQTQGRGRQDKSFFSPTSTGVYMSIILRPKLSASESLFITTSAAVAVAKAIESASKIQTKIKWVNDVFCDNKKVCGILTEAAFGLESGGVEYIVLGIGINVTPPREGFPKELEDIASSIFGKKAFADTRNKLAAEVLENFFTYYKDLPNNSFIDEYKSRSLLMGREITLIAGDTKTEATAIDIDDECRLIVKLKDGTIKALSYGEVSAKLT